MCFSNSKWFAIAEAVSIFAMIQLYIWRLRFHHPLSWAAILVLLLVSHAWRHETPTDLGFNRANLKFLVLAFAPLVSLLAMGLLAMGILSGDIREVSLERALLILLAYCVWGTFQQYVLNAYFVNRFVEISPSGAPLLAALFFSGVHMPNWFLMIVTLAGGFASASLYLRFRNIYFLGLAHGIIGFLLYICVPDTISHHLYVGPKWFS